MNFDFINFVTLIIGAISGGLITQIINIKYASRKAKEEVNSGVIDNMNHAMEFYKALVDDQKAQFTELLESNKELRANNQELERLSKENIAKIKALESKIKAIYRYLGDDAVKDMEEYLENTEKKRRSKAICK